VTVLEISDHVRENSRVARRPGSNREFRATRAVEGLTAASP
jgi:hypothetical protein